MHLAEEGIEAFDSFITYLYKDRLPQFSSTMQCTAENFDEHNLYTLFFLAEKVCCDELANKVMDAIQDFELLNEVISGNENTTMIYGNTLGASKLRNYCVLMGLYFWRSAEDDDENLAMWAANTENLARTLPDFSGDFVKFQFQYRDRFKKGNVADAQVTQR
jgi:hypothetical protein